MRILTRIRRPLLVFLILPILARAQTTPASNPSPSSAPLHIPTERASELSLAILATRAAGPSPASLTAAQLILRIDGQPATQFKIAAAPRSLIFVIDTINSSLQQLLHIRDTLQTFLLENSGHLELPASVVIFSDHKLTDAAGSGAQNRELARHELFAQRFGPTADGAELSRKLQQFPFGFSRILPTQGADGQMERVTLSLRALAFLADSQINVPGVKLVVWISPGWPSMLGSRQSPSALFDSATFFAEALQQSHIVVDVLNSEPIVDVRSANFWTGAVRFPRSPAATDQNDLALQVLALQSGGRLFGNEHTIQASLAACVEDARSLFLLTAPAPVSSTVVHQLTLETADPGLQIRMRPSFVVLPRVAQPKASN